MTESSKQAFSWTREVFFNFLDSFRSLGYHISLFFFFSFSLSSYISARFARKLRFEHGGVK